MKNASVKKHRHPSLAVQVNILIIMITHADGIRVSRRRFGVFPKSGRGI